MFKNIKERNNFKKCAKKMQYVKNKKMMVLMEIIEIKMIKEIDF